MQLPEDDEVVVLVRLDPGVATPRAARPGDAGLDLVTTDDVVLRPGERATVGTGVRLALPFGTVAFVMPRSGLAARHGVTVLNAPGTVDAGYRGEVRVTLLNTDPDNAVSLAAGDRVAQLVVMTLPTVRMVEVDRLPGSDRGEGGFGSTGTSARTSTTSTVTGTTSSHGGVQ